nr:MAG TPA: hypothetical protein [Caudoviricetes sp.]
MRCAKINILLKQLIAVLFSQPNSSNLNLTSIWMIKQFYLMMKDTQYLKEFP